MVERKHLWGGIHLPIGYPSFGSSSIATLSTTYVDILQLTVYDDAYLYKKRACLGPKRRSDEAQGFENKHACLPQLVNTIRVQGTLSRYHKHSYTSKRLSPVEVRTLSREFIGILDPLANAKN